MHHVEIRPQVVDTPDEVTEHNVTFDAIQKKQGLNVRIIVSQEDSNKNMISKLEENNFDVLVIPRFGSRGYNRMHNKFCIIDMDYVMHGSYNWTPTANNNEETLATALDHELVTKFAKEFMKLYNGIYF